MVRRVCTSKLNGQRLWTGWRRDVPSRKNGNGDGSDARERPGCRRWGRRRRGGGRGTEPSGARRSGIEASPVTLRYGTAAAAGEIWSRVAR